MRSYNLCVFPDNCWQQLFSLEKFTETDWGQPEQGFPTEIRTLWRPAHRPEVARFPQRLPCKGSGQREARGGAGSNSEEGEQEGGVEASWGHAGEKGVIPKLNPLSLVCWEGSGVKRMSWHRH